MGWLLPVRRGFALGGGREVIVSDSVGALRAFGPNTSSLAGVSRPEVDGPESNEFVQDAMAP